MTKSNSNLDQFLARATSLALNDQQAVEVDEGIWYRSGRVFYADPDLEVEPN